ncbi:MAG: membrane protein insertase YidC [Candidatus Marinimicrobia bacterium]|nr:membrane protein insertase YidC [Candidatus Neomarinimicrobiota bacterium]
MEDQRNFIMAIALSVIVLIGWDYFFSPRPIPQPVSGSPSISEPPSIVPGAQTDLSAPVSAPVALPSVKSVESQLQTDARLRIATPHLQGSISLTGARFDDITLARYRENLDPNSPEIVLLSPMGSPRPYFAEHGWVASDTSIALPTSSTVWTPQDPNAVLTDQTPIVLTWDNGQGLIFTRVIRAEDEYLFTVEQKVENAGKRSVTLYPYSLVARIGEPETLGFFILHEGPIGVFNRTLKEMDYDDLIDKERESIESTGGWIGFTDKYWLTSVAFDQKLDVTANYTYSGTAERRRYQTDLRANAITLESGETKSITAYVFAGAKELALLDRYEKTPGLSRFDLAIDFGWFYFLTRPFFLALRWLNSVLGNYGVAIIVFTAFLRLLIFPIANKQYTAMNKMKELQPEMKRLQEKHANDKMKLQQEMMELYKREKANPLTGCLPILLQIPIFFALYKVLFVAIEMRHAPFFGWIKDLSAPDPTSILNLFGLLPFTPPESLSLISIGVLPLLMGFFMYLQQKLAPQPPDPTQAKIMMLLPVVFTFVSAQFPAGLVIYWAWTTLLGILQQWILMRRSNIKV